MILLAFFLTLSAQAAPVSYHCFSYSHQYQLDVTVGADAARIDVLQSDDKGPLALPLGKIELAPREEETTEWIGFEGYSSRHNHVTFRMRYADLRRGGTITPNLSVSPDYTDTYDVELGLSCEAR